MSSSGGSAVTSSKNSSNFLKVRSAMLVAAIIKGSGHYPMLEDPARFNELWADFIGSLDKKTKS